MKKLSLTYCWYGTIEVEMPDDEKNVHGFAEDMIGSVRDKELHDGLDLDGDSIVLTGVFSEEGDSLWEKF